MPKILIVDDRATNRQFLTSLLGYQQHSLLEASDGVEGLRVAREEHPDLIISDVLMPVMDGYEFVRQLRKEPEIADTPVIFSTGHYLSCEAKSLAAKCGVNSILFKPTEPEVVLEIVGSVLREHAGLYSNVVEAEEFKREHLQLLTNKLADRTVELRDVRGQLVAENARAEGELSESRAQLAAIVDSAMDAIITVDSNQRVLIFNGAAETMFGCSASEAIGQSLDRFIPTRFRADHAAHIREFGKTEARTQTIGVRPAVSALRANGEEFPVEASISQIEVGGQKLYTVIMRDISERKRAEELRRRSEILNRGLVEHLPHRVFVKDQNCSYLFCNSNYARDLGIEPEEIVGKDDFAFFPLALAEAYRVDDREVLAGGKIKDVEERYTLAGEERWIHTSKVPYRNKEGETIGVLGVFEDITERKHAEAQRDKLAALVEASPDFVGYADPATSQIQYINKGGRRMCGVGGDEDVRKLNIADVHPAWMNKRLAEVAIPAATSEGLWEGEGAFLHRDGHEIPVLMTLLVRKSNNGEVEFLYTVSRDMTERRHLEEQLRQSQKMEAIGQLAGGVAHDFNNLLTAINGYSSLALERASEGDVLYSYLEEINKAGDRAANLTRQLLAFGRKQMLQPIVLNLNNVVGDMNKMLRRLIGEDINLTAKLDPALKQIKADPGQIEQVLVNLVVNARDAMPQGGALTLETTNFEMDRGYVSRHVGAQPGNYVMLAINDTGIGIDAATKARIFEPFFTTKEKGKGTGLGLSTVYGIVKQSGGYIWVDSEPGQGTSFQIYLPQMETAVKSGKSNSPDSTAPRGLETIMLVEDDDAVRDLARTVLEQSGYQVLDARGGEEAICLHREHSAPIHLLLTDVVMPKTSGIELANRMALLRPSIQVLFMSGYTDEAIEHHGIVDSDVQFIQKPFSPTALAKKVRDALDHPTRRPKDFPRALEQEPRELAVSVLETLVTAETRS